MIIGLLPFDSKFPNLALMKLSTYHRNKGNITFLMTNEEMTEKYKKLDVLYVSTVFSKNSNAVLGLEKLFPATTIIYGGSGTDYSELPYEIEHLKPDYSLYPDIIASMGFMTRGCIRKCSFCIVRQKEGELRFNAHLKEFIDPKFKNLILMDNNILAYHNNSLLEELRDSGLKVDFNQGIDFRLLTIEKIKILSEIKCYNHKFDKKTLRLSFDDIKFQRGIKKTYKMLLDAGFKKSYLIYYILSYPDDIESAVKRVEIIKELGGRPFIMKINQYSGSKELNKLAHWVNYIPYYQCIDWKDYDPNMRKPRK